ncbi:MAG TPA: endonuclease/exonuclease/phosphatase family protein [Bryobacteraceae bacterium]|nr:endonuclease/exonuclease/phosphatase family protein [Bryobacteraceae bacterium]
MVFRVTTYNVHKCKGMDWRVSPARVADVIVRLETEILATQEILLSQADEISKRISVPFIFGVARQHAGEPYGNALFTKLPVVSHENYDLTVIGREQRKCLRVSLLFPEERKVHLFAAHLGTSYTERRKQARQLLSPDILLSARFRTHRIVAGDFNEWTRGLTSQLLSEHLQSADINMHLKRGKTYPGIVPFMHLDHIYYDRDFELLDMHLYRSRLSLMASDHLPLVAKFAV